jgi:hypothetical protein
MVIELIVHDDHRLHVTVTAITQMPESSIKPPQVEYMLWHHSCTYSHSPSPQTGGQSLAHEPAHCTASKKVTCNICTMQASQYAAHRMQKDARPDRLDRKRHNTPRHVPHHSSSRHTRQGNHLDNWMRPVEWQVQICEARISAQLNYRQTKR